MHIDLYTFLQHFPTKYVFSFELKIILYRVASAVILNVSGCDVNDVF